MINNGQSTLLLYRCEDVKSHRSGGDTVPLKIAAIETPGGKRNLNININGASDFKSIHIGEI